MNTSANIVTVHVPFTIRKYGGRKQIIMPEGAPAAIGKPRIDNTLIKALARAFRWKKMLESGQFTTVTELARHEKLAFSYMTRVLRLTLLAPDIVEMILDGRQPPEMMLGRLLEPFPVEWEKQRHFLFVIQ
jgi:hypothetical protein